MSQRMTALIGLVCFAGSACSQEKVEDTVVPVPPVPGISAGVTLSAKAGMDAYTLINDALAGRGDVLETPDCAHEAAAPHIKQVYDDFLKTYVFAFEIHVTPDNDKCNGKKDRQRNEIKTYGSSPDSLKASLNESVGYSWKFKLDKNFKPSPNFTHIHQIKPIDGDADMPIITLTARYKASGEVLEVIHTGGTGKNTSLKYLVSVPLADFKGHWVEVTEKATFSHQGKYEIIIKRLADDKELVARQVPEIDMWREETSFCRPKWGIYRSLLSPSYIRDETVWFNDFNITEY